MRVVDKSLNKYVFMFIIRRFRHLRRKITGRNSLQRAVVLQREQISVDVARQEFAILSTKTDQAHAHAGRRLRLFVRRQHGRRRVLLQSLQNQIEPL